MKDIGFKIALTLAVFTLAAGGYYIFTKDFQNPPNTMVTKVDVQESAQSPTSIPNDEDEKKNEKQAQQDIDAEIKELDIEIDSALDSDAETDPALGF